jgi:hypothetical protein
VSCPIDLRTTLRRRSSAPGSPLQERRSRANALEAHECGPPSGPQCVPFPPRVPMVDRPFPPRRHRWPTSSCARQPRKSRWESPRLRREPT